MCYIDENQLSELINPSQIINLLKGHYLNQVSTII